MRPEKAVRACTVPVKSITLMASQMAQPLCCIDYFEITGVSTNRWQEDFGAVNFLRDLNQRIKTSFRRYENCRDPRQVWGDVCMTPGETKRRISVSTINGIWDG